MSRSSGKIIRLGSRSGQSGRVVMINGVMRVASLIVAVLIAIFGLFMVSGSAFADDEKYDFYTLSSNTTAYFSDAAEPGKGNGLDSGWSDLAKHASEGGGLLGYGDNDVSGFSGWLVSQATGSSNTVGYDSLKVKSEGGWFSSPEDLYNGVLAYGQYGSLLNDMGLDSMSTGLGLHLGNLFGGSIMTVLYLLAASIDFTFAAVFWILDSFNPFKLFFSAIAVTSTTMANGMTGGQGVPAWMQSLETWFGGWYQALVNLSWTVLVPLFIATFVFSSLMWKKGNALGGLKKLAIRLLFLGVGLPLIGSMYTGALAAMNDATGGASMGATRVIASTYVDFESWAKNDRLIVPEGAVMEWDSSRHAATGVAMDKVRQTALAVNKEALGLDVGEVDVSSIGSISSAATTPDGSIGGSGGLHLDDLLATLGMLSRYTVHQAYQASDFDTSVKGRITRMASSSDHVKQCATTWFNVQSDGSTTEMNYCSGVDATNNPILRVADGSGLKANTVGNIVTFSSNGGRNVGDSVTDPNGKPVPANLSALSMYNYLNTTFGSNSATTYSSSNSISAATREYHQSVNLVGTPTLGFLYWTNSVALLLCFIVLGLAYAFGMLIGTVKNSLRVITSVPFATLGSLAGIAKVVIYSFTMIVEIIGTLFVYRVVQQILISVPSIFEGSLEHLYAMLGDFGNNLRGAGVVTALTSVLSTVLLVLLTIMLVRFRGVFIKALTEAVTKIVDKFLDTSVAPPAGSGLIPALASGVGAGVGSAAANRLMSGRGGAGGGSAKGGVASGLTMGSGGVQSPDGGAPGSNAMPSINGTDGPGPDEIGPGSSGDNPIGPGDGGGARALPAGNGGVSAHIEAGTSSGGDGGSSSTSASDREIAGGVEARGGLSEPRQIEAGPNVGGADKAGSDAAASSSVVNASDDAISEASGSMEQSMAEHREADKARVGQATAGAKAVWHGGKAAARAYAGDTAGAVQDGQKALQNAQDAKNKGQEAKAHRQAANTPSVAPSAGSSSQQSAPARRGAVGSRPAQQVSAQASSAQTQVQGQTQGGRPAPSRSSAPASQQAKSATPVQGRPASVRSGRQQQVVSAPSSAPQRQSQPQVSAPARPASPPSGSGSSGPGTPPSMPSAPMSAP